MLIFLYGDDTRRSREKLKQLTEKFLADVDPSGLNLTRNDGAKLTPDSLGVLLSATPFLARRRMVCIEGLFGNKDKRVFEVLERSIETLKPISHLSSKGGSALGGSSKEEDTIVLLWEEGAPKHPLAKKLTTLRSSKGGSALGGFAEHFGILKTEDSPAWIAQTLNAWGVAIDPHAARSLAERFPGNTWALATELHKLASYARSRTPDTGYRIQVADVDLLSGSFAEEPLYMLTSALEAGSLAEAARRLRALGEGGTPLLVLMSVVGKFLGNVACEKRGALAELKLHPYVEKKIRSVSRRVSPPALAALIERFLALEYKMKTTRHCGEVEVLRLLAHATATLSPPPLSAA